MKELLFIPVLRDGAEEINTQRRPLHGKDLMRESERVEAAATPVPDSLRCFCTFREEDGNKTQEQGDECSEIDCRTSGIIWVGSVGMVCTQQGHRHIQLPAKLPPPPSAHTSQKHS